MQDFLPVAALPQWGLSVKVAHLLGLRGPWRRQVCRDTDCLHHRSYGPVWVVYRASCGWRSEGLFGQSFSVTPPIQALRGLPCPGSFSIVGCVRHRGASLAGVLLCRWAHQAHKGSAWVGCCSVAQWVRRLTAQPLYCSAGRGGREAMVMAPPPTLDSAVSPCFHVCLAFRPGISHHDLLPHIPSICLSTVTSSPHPGTAPQSLNSSSQPLHLPGDLHPCPRYVWLQ